MKWALAISAVVHAVLGAALLSVELREGEAFERPAAIAIEVIAAPPQTAETALGGGISATPEGDAPAAAPAPKSRGRAKRATRREDTELGTYALERPLGGTAGGAGVTGDGGEGAGAGGGRGPGIGLGDGDMIRLAESLALPEAPAGERPRPSKARPAKLVYPSKQRDLGADELFVARVTVDSDGFVVGARLVRGRNGPRDQQAADLIFRFRYLPALDHDGRAITSTFEQPFHVGR